MVNEHKAYSDIETTITRFYGGHEDGELAALKVAGAALSVALGHVEPVNVEAVTAARATVWRLIGDRQAELERREREAQGGCACKPGCDRWLPCDCSCHEAELGE